MFKLVQVVTGKSIEPYSVLWFRGKWVPLQRENRVCSFAIFFATGPEDPLKHLLLLHDLLKENINEIAGIVRLEEAIPTRAASEG